MTRWVTSTSDGLPAEDSERAGSERRVVRPVHIFDSQVADPVTAKPTMYFLNRQGQRVSGYVSSDCVFVEVVDPDQNEDSLRRERVDGYWDGGQNLPFGPQPQRIWAARRSGGLRPNIR